MSTICIRRALATDLEALITLEEHCFPPDFQESPASLRYSLESPHQEVWIAERDNTLLGALFLRLYKRSLRIYSVAVAREAQGQGHGAALMRHAVKRATELGRRRLILEANAGDASLVRWYAGMGFRTERRLPGYYSGKVDALKMVRSLDVAN